MALTLSQQAIGLAFLRISPLAFAIGSGCFSYFAHEYVLGFKHRNVPYEARSAVIPGWWDHIRLMSLPFIWGTFLPNFFLGLLNSYNSTLFGLLGDGATGTVGTLPARLYLVGALFSVSYYPITLVAQFVPLQFDVLMNTKLPAAKREAGLDKFLRMDFRRGMLVTFPSVLLFVAATTLWVAEQL